MYSELGTDREISETLFKCLALTSTIKKTQEFVVTVCASRQIHKKLCKVMMKD